MVSISGRAKMDTTILAFLLLTILRAVFGDEAEEATTTVEATTVEATAVKNDPVILWSWASLLQSKPVISRTVSNPGSNITSRTGWGARSPKHTPDLLTINPVPMVIIHHAETPACTTQENCKATVRSIQNHHMDINNWHDIGYNFLVGEDGNVYEGRGWGIRGAHSPLYNIKSIGICVIGTFTDHNPNEAAIEVTQKLIAYGVSIGQIKDDYGLFGHHQTRRTDCPGKSFAKLIQTWPHYVWGTYFYGYPEFNI